MALSGEPERLAALRAASVRPVIESLTIGIALGLSAGLAPGPLLALVLGQTVRHGFGHGLRVALAPLVTDLPIVLGSVLLVGSVAGNDRLVGLISIAGALVVVSIARDTWRATVPEARAAADGPVAFGSPDTPESPHSWRRGILVNLLSPHPYLFWLTVGAPTLVSAARGGALPPVGFVVGFYGCLVGSKALVAWLISRTGLRPGSPRYRLVMRLLALVLVAFAIVLVVEGLAGLGLPIALPFGTVAR